MASKAEWTSAQQKSSAGQQYDYSGGQEVATQNESGRVTTDKASMSQPNLAALEGLIKQLMGGGTEEMERQRRERERAIAQQYALLGQVSPEAAMASGQRLMSLNLQQALEKMMPSISRSVEGAGMNTTSMQGVLGSLMSRDAALGAGALGAQQEAAFAQQRSGLSDVLERLTRADPQATNALIQALGAAKGSVERGTTTSTGPSRTSSPVRQGSSGLSQKPSWETQSSGGVRAVGADADAYHSNPYYSYNTNQSWNPAKVGLADFILKGEW